MALDARLAKALSDPGFTPKSKDVPALVGALGDADEEVVRNVERALSQKKDESRAALIARIGAREGDVALLVRACLLLSRLSADTAEAHVTAAVDALLPMLTDAEKRVRRAAARGLGNMQDARIEAALVATLERATDADEKKVLVDALAKIGGALALDALSREKKPADSLLKDKQTRAELSIKRTLERDKRAVIDPSRAPREPLRCTWHCRDGLEELLGVELESRSAIKVSPGKIEGTLGDSLAQALRARIATHISFPLSRVRVKDDDVAQAVTDALTGTDAKNVFDAFSRGGIVTVRVAWEGAGHRRKDSWRVAELLASAPGRIRNDATDATWEARVRVFREEIAVELVPRSVQDTRFSYRLRDVPAASHPTIAAALARLARPLERDVAWDPFCGSGSELVECAHLANGITLYGTDTDDAALAAAGENLTAANLTAEISKNDALTFKPPQKPSLVITNPPMGRRVHREKDLADVLDSFVRHVAKILAPHGRLVWLAPHPEATRAVAQDLRLNITYSRRVDLGGFFAEMMRLEKTK